MIPENSARIDIEGNHIVKMGESIKSDKKNDLFRTY